MIGTLDSLPKITVKFLWVSGHEGSTHNEKVNYLAKDAIKFAFLSQTNPSVKFIP